MPDSQPAGCPTCGVDLVGERRAAERAGQRDPLLDKLVLPGLGPRVEPVQRQRTTVAVRDEDQPPVGVPVVHLLRETRQVREKHLQLVCRGNGWVQSDGEGWVQSDGEGWVQSDGEGRVQLDGEGWVQSDGEGWV